MSKGNRSPKGEKALRWLTEKSPFPSKLRRLMEKNGTTQQQLADVIGVTRQTISQYTGGQTVPDIYTVQLIADYFHVSVISLLESNGPIKQYRDFDTACTAFLPPDLHKLFNDIMRLTDEGRDKVAVRVSELMEIPRYNAEWQEYISDYDRYKEFMAEQYCENED